jgi:hypothetical protein
MPGRKLAEGKDEFEVHFALLLDYSTAHHLATAQYFTSHDAKFPSAQCASVAKVQ